MTIDQADQAVGAKAHRENPELQRLAFPDLGANGPSGLPWPLPLRRINGPRSPTIDIRMRGIAQRLFPVHGKGHQEVATEIAC